MSQSLESTSASSANALTRPLPVKEQDYLILAFSTLCAIHDSDAASLQTLNSLVQGSIVAATNSDPQQLVNLTLLGTKVSLLNPTPSYDFTQFNRSLSSNDQEMIESLDSTTRSHYVTKSMVVVLRMFSKYVPGLLADGCYHVYDASNKGVRQ
jgi:hypothetical protein